MITFVDAGVLIAAARGRREPDLRALAILNDPAREYASSVFVRLEVMPKAVYYGYRDEVAFYEAYFAGVSYWVEPVEAIVTAAVREAETYGLAGMDALHIAAAALVGADELVTNERPGKPIFRTKSIQVVSI